MTAIVGILNKRAIAIAADSAETIGAGVKIYNKANKIFTLSKHHPVGIAIYSDASFNSLIPWEIIIKMYRRQLDSKSFGKLKEYADDFVAFLEQYLSKHLLESECNEVICRHLFDVYRSDILPRLQKSDLKNGLISAEGLPDLNKVLSEIKTNAVNANKFPLLSFLSFEDFVSVTDELFKQLKLQIEKVKGNYSCYENLLKETFYEIYTSNILTQRLYTGLAFFGFGEDEIFPSLYRIEVHSSINNHLVFAEIENHAISNMNNAVICPMAQTDVIAEYITGIHPDLEQVFVNLTEGTIKNVLNTIKNVVKPWDLNLANSIGNVDLSLFLKQFINDIKAFKQKNVIGPLINTVATMEKEDLAELAENLIYLTSLKRRITPFLESVGGPVDVAVVSKGDGFIWIKRKHYFSSDLNKNFFETYFES